MRPFQVDDELVEGETTESLETLEEQKTEHLIAQLTLENTQLTKELAHWKANHDNQVRLRSMISERPDLGDRAEKVAALITENERLQKLTDCGISWSGFNLYGDRKSINEVQRLIGRDGQCSALENSVMDYKTRFETLKETAKKLIKEWSNFLNTVPSNQSGPAEFYLLAPMEWLSDALAGTPPESAPSREFRPEPGWLKRDVDRAAKRMDEWFGTPDHSQPEGGK